MPIEFRCHECDNLLRTPQGSSGKKGRCPSCGATMVIPEPKQDLASPFAEETAPAETTPPEQQPAATEDTPEPAVQSSEPEPAATEPTASADSTENQPPLRPLQHQHPAAPSQEITYPNDRPLAPAHPADTNYPPRIGRAHRGAMVFILGILGLTCAFGCCMGWCSIPITMSGLVMAAIAVVIGHVDLRDMNEGKMDPSGKDLTRLGYTIGIVGCCIILLELGTVAIIFISTIVMSVANQ